MSLHAGSFQLWDFSQVSSLASSLSVSRCGEKRKVVSGNTVADDAASGDFGPKLPSTALGDFTNIWQQLKSEVVLQDIGSERASSNSHHQTEDLLNPSLIADNISKLSEDLGCRYRETKQGKSNPSYARGHVEEKQQTASRPCRPQRSATYSEQVEVEDTTTNQDLEKTELKMSIQKIGIEGLRRRTSPKPNTIEHLPPCSFPIGSIGPINDARLEPASRDSGLQFSNNSRVVTATLRPDTLRKSLPEKSVSFVHSDSEIGLRHSKISCSKTPALARRNSQNNRPKSFLNGKPTTRQSYKRIQPSENSSFLVQQAEAWDKGGQLPLLFKLIQNFSEEREWLVKPIQLADHTSSPHGIHVFVDFSNLSIGFNNFMKMIDGIPLDMRTKFKNLSFEALVLLMERQRPVSKRVLAGSLPFVPAFEMAKAIGYELNILDKVFKAKEVKSPTRNKSYKSTRLANSSYPSSGSETTGNSTHATEKWVEQGVDEILHLKILESVVDVEIPTTMVLGTGDGAVAEYSQGFFAMVERALRKGWNVELVSWSHNIGHAYKKRSFRSRWSQQFKIIELDSYASELKDN